ncbi:hypothetical protein WAI453_002849 [Rhynchosporium graminicola]|uniref:Uncharacterized protein n=1 Tax=Rhynchosporium graminicola TaxID=2792576 RepID=A0A1E1JVE6_9HELO|nr:uncharacterized protein RCO7_02424 [Rhynchosporium commune]
MPPTTPTRSCSSPHSPNRKQSKQINLSFQKPFPPFPPSTPAQNSIFSMISSPPPSSPVETVSIRYSRPSSPICAEELTNPFIKLSKPYVINFGRHHGKTLSQVPDSYVWWLQTKIKEGWFRQERYDDLRAALADDDDSASEQIPGPLSADWKPPALESTPSIFHDQVTSAPLWISEDDACRYFKLDRQYLEYLPKVSGGRHGVIRNAHPR